MINFKAASMANPQTIYITGAGPQTYNVNTYSNNTTYCITDTVNVVVQADSSNSTNITLNQVVLGVA